MTSVTLLRELPGAEKGSIHKISVISGIKLRGVTIGSKFYYESDLLKYPKFFETK